MKVEGPDQTGHCWPKCVFFKCAKNVLQPKGNVLWCEWLEQPCLGPSCAYASCIRNKLLPENKCGLVVKRITRDTISPDDFKVDLRLKGKAAKRLDDDDIV